MARIDKDLCAFEQYRAQLVQEHEGEYLLIWNGEFHGTYQTEEEALQYAYNQFGNVDLMVGKIGRVSEFQLTNA